MDSVAFRRVLGQYPTGVCVVTAVLTDGRVAGMVVGSFTSVSLSPPLVAFLPDRASGSWALLAGCRRFCVNILGADQEDLCRKLASRDPERFSDICYNLSPAGEPILDGAVAWIDCERHSIQEAGDHYIVIGSVTDLEIASGGLPLLFFQGGYGRFTPSALIAFDTRGMMARQLRRIEHARPLMERLASSVSGQCFASVRVDDEIIIAASAGHTSRGSSITLVGQRWPFSPPGGSVFAAWLPEGEAEAWLRRGGHPDRVERWRAGLKQVREKGYSIGLLSEAHEALHAIFSEVGDRGGMIPVEAKDLIALLEFDPIEQRELTSRKIWVISVPVFDHDRMVEMTLSLCGFPALQSDKSIADLIKVLSSAANKLQER